LQHVLPKAFQKVRYYGFFSSSQRHRLQRGRHLLGAASLPQPTDLAQLPSPDTPASNSPVIPCPTCGRPMRHSHSLPPQHCRSP
jgi:hypothetical protein